LTIDAALLQWGINQGVAVLVLVVGILVLGRKLDMWNAQVEQLTIAVNALTAMVQAHMPSGR